jgi:hypothetical protein
MLLMVALIVAGPEVFFVRQMSAHLLHIMLGLYSPLASFFCLPASKS